MKKFFQNLNHDIRRDTRAFARNRSALLVANLLVLPWAWVIVSGRNLNAWQYFLQVLAIMGVYWFFTRRRGIESIVVRQPLVEAAIALALVLVWMLFRIGQYTNAYVLPEVRVASVNDILDTIAPKMLEMFFLPLAIWLALRYRPSDLGLRSKRFDWAPALLPIAALIFLGLRNNKPQEYWDSIVYFFFGAGVPEEFLFRGIVQTRLEALLKSPAWGLYLGALVFGASHLPINLSAARADNWLGAFESAFTFQLTVGFALGYAYQRVRSLPPLMVIHTLIDAAP